MPISSQLFAQVIAKYFPQGVPPLVIALSGGADSMCLAYLLAQHKKLYQPDMKLLALTIDHSYRENSSIEAHSVGDIVSQWGLDQKVRKIHYETSDMIKSSKFEEIARQKRYQEFKKYCNERSARNLFVAHNLNDQFETYLYRLLGESTILGLRSLKPISLIPVEPEGPNEVTPYVIRPLLQFSKREIVETCKQEGTSWFEDPTNKDTSLTIRNRLRYYIMDYVPLNVEHDSSLEVLSAQNLEATVEKIGELDDYIKRQAIQLEKVLIAEDRLEFNEHECTMKFMLTYDEFESNSVSVLSRLLYGNIYPVASTTEYHWKYAKLERSAVPKFKKLFEDLKNSETLNKVQEKMTFLNVLFTVTIDDISRRVVIDLKRAPVAKNMLPQAVHTLSSKDQWEKWFLWDNRYWIRILAEDKHREIASISVTPYVHKLHYKLFEQKFPNFDVGAESKLGQVPVVIVQYAVGTESGTESYDISVPGKFTSNEGIRVETELKRNIFKNIMEIKDEYEDREVRRIAYEAEQDVEEPEERFIIDEELTKVLAGEKKGT